jgi:hypothetical protein
MQNPKKAAVITSTAIVAGSIVSSQLIDCHRAPTYLNRDVLVSLECFPVWRAPGVEKSHADKIGGSSTSGTAPRFVWKLKPALKNSGCDRKMDRS